MGPCNVGGYRVLDHPADLHLYPAIYFLFKKGEQGLSPMREILRAYDPKKRLLVFLADTLSRLHS